MFAPLLKKLFGSKNEREVKRMLKAVQAVNALEEQMLSLSDEQLRSKTEEFKARLEKGETLDQILPEAFAVCREAGKRVMGMRHFDVQLIGGMTLHEGRIAEMRTGEGKTLVATLAVYLNALAGKGVHVVTVNDYLARRDANWMRPLYEFLGLSVGIVTPFQPPEEKRAAYAADITYGTNNEFGFDYLRDNMAFSLEEKNQRELNFAVIDEVDSILIDEARTPLIISGQAEDSSKLYQQINQLIPRLTQHIEEEEGVVTQEGHFSIDEKTRQVELNEQGHQYIEEMLTQADFVTLHTPLTDGTREMIGAPQLAIIKEGARIINGARGELIDEAALLEALESGQVAAAALDVFPTEPPGASALVQHPNVLGTPHIGGSSTEAQEEVGFRIAEQVRDFLHDGVVRNAVNLPTVSAEEYRRLRPFLELAERLGAFAAQVAGPMSRVHLTYAGAVGEMNTHLLRNAALKGVLSHVLSEPANLVNAAQLAAERGLTIEEAHVRREQGFPNTLGVTLQSGECQFSVEGTVVHGSALRLLRVDDIEIEAPLEGTLLFTRNRDVPGVIGQIGTVLGSRNVNIATFALGRRERSGSMGSVGAGGGAEALAIVRVDGPVPETLLEALRGISAVTFARVVQL